jgi:gliding motility-associated-like protein
MRKLIALCFVIQLNALCLIGQTGTCAGSLEFLNSNDAVHLPIAGGNQYYSSNGFTWECWVKLTTPFASYSSQLLRPIICAIDPVAYEDMCLSFGWSGGVGNVASTHLCFKVDGPNSSTGASNVSCDYVPAGGFLLGTWYHVAGTMDYVNHISKLYLNGALVDTKVVNSAPITRVIPSELSWDIAINPGYANLPLGGNMDEVRIWSLVRTPAEIATYYNQCLAGNEPGLVDYYRCNQSSGSIATDATANSYNGTLSNMAGWSVLQPVLTGSNCSVGCCPVIATNDTTICTSGSVQLTAASSTSYSWSTGSTNQTVSVNASGTYLVQLNSPGCSSITDTFHVNINIPPVIDLIHDTSLCGSTFCSFNESAANASTYTWSTGASSSSINVNTAGIYWVDMKINQCVVRDSAAFVVLSIPVVTASNYSVCIGKPVTITPVVNGGTGVYTYNWGNGNTNPFYTTTPLADSVYSIKVTDANGCSAPIVTGSVTVFPPLNVSVTGMTTCSFDTVNLTAIVSGGNGNYSYTWSPSGSHQNPFSVAPLNTTIYTITVSDGCSLINATDTAQITIVQAPSIGLPTSVSGCEPVCITLNNIPYNTLSVWQWNYGNGMVSSAQDSFYCYTRSGAYNISFSYTTTTGCVKTVISNSIVTVFPQPVAAFSASAFETDILNTHIYFYNESTNYINLNWSFGDLTTSTSKNPSHNYSSIGEYPVTLIANNQYGCIDTIVHEISITDVFTFYVPNSFTPNQDQLNEVFLPTGSGWDAGSFRMDIFDRWGNHVLSTNDALLGWDGRIKGVVAAEDIYVWKVTMKDIFNKPHSYSGAVSLIK